MININWDKHLDFDAQVPPPGMREVIFVKGTPYEMGKQYGEKTKKMIKRNFCLVAGDALKNYTPEMHAPDFRTGTRGFGVAEDAIAYMLHGTADTAVSFMPGSKGKYAKIQLKHTPDEVLFAFEDDAVLAAWEAAERMALTGDRTKEKLDILDEAKRHIYAGKNYLAKLKVYNVFDEEEARKHYGYAASEFSYAYVLAQTV